VPSEPGRVYVVQRAGSVRVLAGGRLRPGRFLDLRPQVSLGGERGLFSLAFHPRYSENRLFYVCYTDRRGDVVVAEYRSDGTVAIPSSARVLVRVPHADSPAHNGGQLAFGPDGRLYVGVGDGGYTRDGPVILPDPNQNGQNLNVLLGKIFSLDVADATPRPEIVAYGLRNPWRFSRVPGRNAFIVADVGWLDREEVNYLALGADRPVNFGWSVYEGRRRRRDAGRLNPAGPLTWPIHTYLTNLRGDCSIIGGYVYRGSVRSLRGRYVFGDYCSGRIWSIRVSPGRASGLRREPYRIFGLGSFGEDARGELYAVSVVRGRMYRFAR
jgi:glucose/arabinose dehydrogenase